MKKVSFSVDASSFKGLPLSARRDQRIEFFNTEGLAAEERLLYQLWADRALKTRVFTTGQLMLAKSEVPHDAFVVLTGEARIKSKGNEFTLGPGSVLGLAEGLWGQPLSNDVFAQTVTNCKVIPIDQACAELARCNPGLKGLFRLSIERVLGKRGLDLPEWLKGVR
jgi:CRP-like cAMP-binding protein